MAYQQWGRMPHHDAETNLLLGGLYLSLGLHNEAGERFETLLTQSVPEACATAPGSISARSGTCAVISTAPNAPSRKCRAGSRRISKPSALHLLSNILMRQQRFDEAIALLNAWRGRKDQIRLAGLRAVQPGRGAGAQGPA